MGDNGKLEQQLPIAHSKYCVGCFIVTGNKNPAQFTFQGDSICEEHLKALIDKSKDKVIKTLVT